MVRKLHASEILGRVWDSVNGKFVTPEVYVYTEESRESRLRAWEQSCLEMMGPEPLPEPLAIPGVLRFKGELAERVRDHLADMGYREKRFKRPEDRAIADFGEEAMYWYLRHTGFDLSD